MASHHKISDEVTVQSFVDALPAKEKTTIELELQSFVCHHCSQHRPIALVSSGGTAADLEVYSVRCLENFSTGLRGAIAVEGFLQRGYAVIHLWREGSASPYGRLLSKGIGISTANHGITMASLGKLFVTGDWNSEEEDQEDQMVQTVLDQATSDPWLSDPNSVTGGTNAKNEGTSYGSPGAGATTSKPSNFKKSSINNNNTTIQLHRRIVHSPKLQCALRERKSALEDGRIITIPFRSVEEYLAKLQLAAVSLNHHQSLVVFLLAAAVSDFYVPLSQRSTHKMQSSSGVGENNHTGDNNEDGSSSLTLSLSPVPKVMGLLHSTWAPNALVCSFKLETDHSLLRQKAERAVTKYGCHIVVGNLLSTRHSQVWILAPSDMQTFVEQQQQQQQSDVNVQEWPIRELSKPKSSSYSGGRGNDDDDDILEVMLLDHVVQTHFEYISAMGNSSSGNGNATAAHNVWKAHQELEKKRQRHLDNQSFWTRLQSTALEWAGVVLGVAISYVVSAALQKRIQS